MFQRTNLIYKESAIKTLHVCKALSESSAANTPMTFELKYYIKNKEKNMLNLDFSFSVT